MAFDAMDFALYVNDVEHIILLDNMRLLLLKFRKFATEKDDHVTLVCRPKNEEEDARLEINSIYGSAERK